MSDSVRVTNLDEGSKYRVAYDLMEKIRFTEKDRPQGREYYLRLYRQCYETVYSNKPIDDIVENKATSMAMSW